MNLTRDVVLAELVELKHEALNSKVIKYFSKLFSFFAFCMQFVTLPVLVSHLSTLP
jgi:hypothetical protein